MTSGPNLPPSSENARRALEAFRSASPGPRRREANREGVRQRVRDGRRIPTAAAGLVWPLGWGLASAAAAAGLIWGIVAIRAPATPEPTAPTRNEAAASAAQPEPRTPAVSAAQPDAVKPDPLPEDSGAPEPERAVRVSQGPALPPASALVEETRMLRAVRAAIAAGELDQAAEALDVYTARFPNGALREDAQAYRVVVKCGRAEDSTILRRAFERRYPLSPHVARIQAACDRKKE